MYINVKKNLESGSEIHYNKHNLSENGLKLYKAMQKVHVDVETSYCLWLYCTVVSLFLFLLFLFLFF